MVLCFNLSFSARMLALFAALAFAASVVAQNPACVYTDEELDVVYDFNPLSRL